jgi:hypothetical protein
MQNAGKINRDDDYEFSARRDAFIAKRHGDPHAFFKATVELGAKLLRLAWGVWRSGRPYQPAVGHTGARMWDRRMWMRKHQRAR